LVATEVGKTCLDKNSKVFKEIWWYLTKDFWRVFISMSHLGICACYYKINSDVQLVLHVFKCCS
jgi:hypothetical protein